MDANLSNALKQSFLFSHVMIANGREHMDFCWTSPKKHIPSVSREQYKKLSGLGIAWYHVSWQAECKYVLESRITAEAYLSQKFTQHIQG